jgi:hypothetical protein
VAPPHHNQEEQQARDNPQRDGQKQPDRPHERAQESPYVGPHDPFSAAEMGQHIGSSGIRSPPAGTEHQNIELARVSQDVTERFYNLLAVGEGSRCLKPDSVIAVMSAARPLFPRKRKSIRNLAMSQKRHGTKPLAR